MEDHVRIAIYKLTSGTAEEAADLAKSGMLPIFKGQPGFIRYGVALLEDGSVASVSAWETHEEAEAAVAAAADFVKANMADRISLTSNHIGDFFFDEGS
jgi:heme-degrading monooxygenase HmoA